MGIDDNEKMFAKRSIDIYFLDFYADFCSLIAAPKQLTATINYNGP